MSSSTERSLGYYICLLLIVGLVASVMTITAAYGVIDWFSAVTFGVLILLPLVGCGSLFAGRPMFMSPYHGALPEVQDRLDEIAEDVREVSN